MQRRVRTAALLLALIGLAVVLLSPTAAASVTPIFVAGNPTCVSLGYDFGFKIDPPNAGTYSIDGINSVTVTTDGVYFDWTSTLGMDAVISKGGPNANLYVYDPPTEATSDTGLHSPINPNNGRPFGLSHIEFCYDYEVTVSKTATTTFTRTYQWTINKTVDGVDSKVIDQFRGDSTSVTYKVEVTKTGSTDSNWGVNGTITIQNNTPLAATITAVTDVVSGGITASVSCSGVGSYPYVLAAGATLNCTYNTALPDGTNRTNTATVTTTGTVGGGTATAAVTFGNPTTEVNATIDVDDTNGPSWQFSNSGYQTYNKTFACDGDEGTLVNTATIRQTGQADSASVTVNCYELQVTKDATTSLTRTYTWTINKTGDQTDLLLSTGQTFVVNYTVTVSASSSDSNWAVSGNIWVNNPAPIPATLNSVSDVVSGAGAASVNCGVTFPYVLSASGTLPCTYSAGLPDGSNRTNTATATLQNSPSGTTDFTGTANVSFSNATVNSVDECINVNDDKYGSLGTVCVGDAPRTFTYSLNVGPYATCGDYTYTNVASFVTNDSGTTGSDSHTVNVDVPCNQGCTLTQGYWKTHSRRGPAPYDNTWALLDPLQENKPFFLSGKTWYQVFWTPPAGNYYYNLAHQYMAAKLNFLNGASSTPAVDAAITWAEAFFNTYTPANAPRSLRTAALGYASTLDRYNNGLIGPGHCSEDSSSAR